MNYHYLGILHGKIHVILLQKRYLSKVTLQNALLDWDRVHLQREIVLYEYIKLLQDGLQLVSNIEGGL